jgi:hypothetical protein
VSTKSPTLSNHLRKLTNALAARKPKSVLVVVGLSLKNLQPRVWDPHSPYYLPDLRAVMVSYADFHRKPFSRRSAMEYGLHAFLGVPHRIKIYLDNGAFYFLNHEGETPRDAYEEFVERAKPDWWPIPQDFIPMPSMTAAQQQACYVRTMHANLSYGHDGYTPVVHVCPLLREYTAAVQSDERLARKATIALGGIVPNLLRASRAMPYAGVFDSLCHVREVFGDKQIHVFGIGGTATLHLAALLRIDSADSSGWRNRAARGLIQLPGSGDRTVAELGNWRGRKPSSEEWDRLESCGCPACKQFGTEGLREGGIRGGSNRAAHNLWVLLEEAKWIDQHLSDGTYPQAYRNHLDNTTYLPLIDRAAEIASARPWSS